MVETANGSSAEETFRIIKDVLKKTPSEVSIVRVGDSAPTYAEELVHLLDVDLPKNVAIEMVSEEGTTRLSTELPNRKGARDVISAIKIAGRFGRPIRRSEKSE